MRRSHGGWLAALVLLLGGCATGPSGNDAAPVTPDAVVVPTLAVATRVPAAPEPDTEAGLTVLVSSADGVDSPALDALASVLDARPGVEVVVVATATSNDTVGETGAPAALIDAATVSGLPAHAVNASVADAVTAGLGRHDAVDLVVVGVDDHPAVGDGAGRSPAVAAARAAAARDVPAIAVTAADHDGIDLPAAVLMLQHVFDLRLDHLLERGGATVLTVPGCAAGTVRGPIEVDPGEGPAPDSDCTAAPGSFADDVGAHAAGYATITPLPG